MKHISESMHDPLSLIDIDRDLPAYTESLHESDFADGPVEWDQPASTRRRESVRNKKDPGKRVRFVAMFP